MKGEYEALAEINYFFRGVFLQSDSVKGVDKTGEAHFILTMTLLQL